MMLGKRIHVNIIKLTSFFQFVCFYTIKDKDVLAKKFTVLPQIQMSSTLFCKLCHFSKQTVQEPDSTEKKILVISPIGLENSDQLNTEFCTKLSCHYKLDFKIFCDMIGRGAWLDPMSTMTYYFLNPNGLFLIGETNKPPKPIMQQVLQVQDT